MNLTRRRGITAFFIVMGSCLIGLLAVLNIYFVHLSGRRLALDVFGFIVFAILMAGVVLNTVFLVREIRRNERQDSFLNSVTHELKTPIASIRLYLETLERRPLDEAQRQRFYTIMRADTDRLLATVESVLKAGTLGNRQRSSHTRVELYPLVAECVQVVLRRHRLPAEAILLDEVPGGVKLYVLGNPEDLRTAVLNLLDNAVKYSPEGIHVRCHLAIEQYTSAVLSISDTGLGIEPGELKRVFKRFYRASSNDQVQIKGTGLGLFLVYTIAKQHGGSVRAVSDGKGKGTTMFLSLPLDNQR
ncbi:sensor histidine kinase [Bryocella elongata]|nr:HAMP domain-containing sensor histidine kinase [Bryocella elongata]